MTPSQTAIIIHPKMDKRPYIIMWVLCMLSILAALSEGIISATPAERINSLTHLSTIMLLTTPLLGFMYSVSYRIIRKTDLEPFTQVSFQKTFYPTIISGILAGFLPYIMNITLFKEATLNYTDIYPYGLIRMSFIRIHLESFYNLFWFSFIYFLFINLFKSTPKTRIAFLWITTLIIALVASGNNLHAIMRFSSISSADIFNVLVCGALIEGVCSWLYWSRGLLAAILGHIIALNLNAFLG